MINYGELKNKKLCFGSKVPFIEITYDTVSLPVRRSLPEKYVLYNFFKCFLQSPHNADSASI